ncbi:kinase-like protein [Rhizophagus irregularis]|nr:kinase-like protein [Rhizophagus irregularis]
MSVTIRKDLIYTIFNKACELAYYSDMHKQFEFQKQTILADKLLTKDEKSEAIKILTASYDKSKLIDNSGTRRANSHLNISNKWAEAIVQCFGLTKDPLNGDYMLVMNKLGTDLRKYLQQNHNQLTWKERTQIAADKFCISDLGFCGPADKPLKSVYGNLPYIAPEVIARKVTTYKSDIYSIGILMWEISSGRPPFISYEHDDCDLAINIINGMRPKIVPGTPLEYKNLMIQCWDANPLNRPDIGTLRIRIRRELNLYYQNKPNELLTQLEEDYSLEIGGLENYTNSRRLLMIKVYQFENLPEPRNATENIIEISFHSNKSYNFHIPNNIDDLDKLNNQKNSSKIISIFKVKNYPKYSKGIQKNDDEIHNNPNLHSEEQDELELPDNIDK